MSYWVKVNENRTRPTRLLNTRSIRGKDGIGELQENQKKLDATKNLWLKILHRIRFHGPKPYSYVLQLYTVAHAIGQKRCAISSKSDHSEGANPTSFSPLRQSRTTSNQTPSRRVNPMSADERESTAEISRSSEEAGCKADTDRPATMAAGDVSGGGSEALSAASPAPMTVAASPSVPPLPPLPPFLLELAAGTAGGAASLCVGHPFDTTKVKLQYGSGRSSALAIVRTTLASEGVAGLYAGIQAPLPFVVLFNAALFTTNSAIRAALGRGRSEHELSLVEVGIAGSGAGAAVSLIAGPTELVKCRMQTNPGKYRGAIDCARRVYAAGGIRAFSVGFGATLVREVPGTAIFFGAYEFFRPRYAENARREYEYYDRTIAGRWDGRCFILVAVLPH